MDLGPGTAGPRDHSGRFGRGSRGVDASGRGERDRSTGQSGGGGRVERDCGTRPGGSGRVERDRGTGPGGGAEGDGATGPGGGVEGDGATGPGGGVEGNG